MQDKNYELMSKLMKMDIYDFLSEEQISKVFIVNIPEDSIFISAVDKKKNVDLYYILEGGIEVISQSYNGRNFLIDTLGKDEFIGKFSQMRKQNFYSDIKTNMTSRLLNLTPIKHELLNDERFMLF